MSVCAARGGLSFECYTDCLTTAWVGPGYGLRAQAIADSEAGHRPVTPTNCIWIRHGRERPGVPGWVRRRCRCARAAHRAGCHAHCRWVNRSIRRTIAACQVWPRRPSSDLAHLPTRSCRTEQAHCWRTLRPALFGIGCSSKSGWAAVHPECGIECLRTSSFRCSYSFADCAASRLSLVCHHLSGCLEAI